MESASPPNINVGFPTLHKEMSFFPNAAISIIGAAIPTVAELVGGSDGTNLQALLTDTSGRLYVINAGTFAVQATLSAETTKVIGTVNQGTSPWVTSDQADMVGTAPGTAPSKTLIIGGIYNSSAPTPSNGQTLPLQLDSGGNLKVTAGSGGLTATVNQGTAAAVTAGWTIIVGQQAETTTAWTSSTTVQTTQAVNIVGYPGVAVTLNQGSTLTGGQVSFEVSDTVAGTNWYPLAMVSTSGSVFSSTYSFAASTNIAFQMSAFGFVLFRVRLSQAITGSGTVNVGIAASAAVDEPGVSSNLVQVSGVTVGTVASGVQKVGIVGSAGAALDSTIGAGTAPANAVAISGQYNTTIPAPTAAQSVGLQVDQNANLLNFPGVQFQVGAVWNSGTAQNTVQYPTGTATIGQLSGAGAVVVQLDQTTTLSAGAVTFQGTFDNVNWITIPQAQLLNPGTFVQLANPYTLQASTNKPFLIVLQGFLAVRANLTTAITGSGTVTPYWSTLAAVPFTTINTTGIVEVSPTTSPNTKTNPFFYALTDGTNVITAAISAWGTAPTGTEVQGVNSNVFIGGSLATFNSSTFSAKIAQDMNLLGTLGTAFTTAGYVDIKGADGNVFVRQTTATNLLAQVSNNGTFVVQATLANETTKVIGTVRCLGNVGAAFDAATAATPPANAVQVGVVGVTALPTAVSTGQLVAPMADKYGRQTVVLNSVRDLVAAYDLNSNSSSAVSFIGSGGSGVFNDIVTLVITNESSTATIVTLTDNGSGGNSHKYAIAANGGIVINYPTPLPQGTSNAAWDVLNSAGVSLDYHAVVVHNK